MNQPLQPPPRIYDSPQEFFDQFLADVYRRPEGFVWCLEWPEHEEAMQVMHAMWLTWEEVQTSADPDNDVTWLRDVMYPLMDRLTDPLGTFHGCDWFRGTHKPYTYPLNAPPPQPA